MVDKEARTRRIVEQFVYCLFSGEKMLPVLHYFGPSPPCRSVLLLGKMLKIDFDLRVVNILEGDHLKPELAAVSFTFSCKVFLQIENIFLLVESTTHDSNARRSWTRLVGEVKGVV